MSLGSYNPRKRFRADSGGDYNMGMQVVPVYNPNRGLSTGGYFRRSGRRKSYYNGKKRSRYLSNLNTSSNPYYPKPEVKYSDTQIGSPAGPSAIPQAGITPISLNNIGGGNLPTNRIGSQITSKSIYYQIIFNFGTASANIAVRHLIVWDRQSNGALPAYADVLTFPAVGIISPINPTNRNRFVVLVDERITLSMNGENIRYVSGFRKINQVSTFEPTGANNFPYTGNLVMMLMSDEPAGTPTVNPTYYGTWRFRYMDN